MEKRLFFPYSEIREGQKEIINNLIKVLDEGKNAVFEAPSGIGKTVAVLSVILPYAIEQDLKVFYMCRTHTQMTRVIEELNAMKERGYDVSGIMLRGKSEMCLMEGLRKLPYKVMVRLCETYKARGTCPYHMAFKEKVTDRLLDTLGTGVHHADRIYKLGKELGVCPHELGLEVAKRVRVVALSYLYLLDRDLRKILLVNLDTMLNDSILIFDEAHNVIDVAQEVESLSITGREIDNVLSSIKEIKVRKIARSREEFESLSTYKYAVVKALRVMKRVLGERATEGERMYPAKEFVYDFELKAKESLLIIVDYLERLIRTASIRRQRPRNILSIEELIEFLNKLVETSYDKRYVHVLSSRGENISYSIYCVDPQVAIKELVEDAHLSIHMSATLSPLSHYIEVCGIPRTHEFKVKPVYAGRVKAAVITGITTAYDERGDKMYESIAKFIVNVVNSLDCNIAIFFPSYEVMDEVVKRLGNLNKPMFMERRGKSTRELEEEIREFKKCWKIGGGVLLGVLGGRTCEGVDYPGRELEVEIVIGVPYPEPSLATYAQMKYYEDKYGEDKAFEYVYKIPAMRKVNQAIGRLVRGPNDYGVVLLGDTRYKGLLNYLADWIDVLGAYPYDNSKEILKFVKGTLERFRQSK